MSDTSVDVLLAHGLSPELVDRLRHQCSRTEEVAALVARHEVGHCGGPAAREGRCPWHVPCVLAGDLDEVTRVINAWMLTGWAEHGLFEPGASGDAGVQ